MGWRAGDFPLVLTGIKQLDTGKDIQMNFNIHA